mmetsp:Transcript_18102/g.43462  ORF Transcript_18102/g.43462 Transcript_18102/m.43462 type:complete len:166 (+) Transcript_18102:78-575(+)
MGAAKSRKDKKRQMKVHKATHKATRKCPHCGKFTDDLEWHISQQHDCKCQKCSKTFDSMLKLHQHLRDAHYVGVSTSRPVIEQAERRRAAFTALDSWIADQKEVAQEEQQVVALPTEQVIPTMGKCGECGAKIPVKPQMLALGMVPLCHLVGLTCQEDADMSEDL